MARPKKSDAKAQAQVQPHPQAQAHPPPQAQVPFPMNVPVGAPPPGMMPAPMSMAPPQGMPMMGAPPPQMPPNRPVIDNDSFLRVRESAVGRLSTIMELLRSFTADYIRQTNLLLGEHTAEGGHQELLTSFDNAAAGQLFPMPEMAPAADEKPQRKKRTHDPNAPKRPLTPYFLYMQHARTIIANDLGTEAPKGAVQEEGQRRWAHMGPEEKSGWNSAYQYNLRLYNARTHSYKSGNLEAKTMSDDAALKYAEEFNIPAPEAKDAIVDVQHNDQDAIAQQLQQVANAPILGGGEEDTSKTPKKTPASRKRKTADASAADTSMATPSAAPATISPDKKRRRSNKAGDEAAEPKKPARGKKTKSS